MNRTARAIGMSSTTFRNPHGLPDSAADHAPRATWRGSAARCRTAFRSYYSISARRRFTYAGRTYRNHNRLIGSVEGVDGIKTGYTRASGFNLVTNVKRGDRHLVAVVMGGKTGASRDAQMRELIAAVPARRIERRSNRPFGYRQHWARLP